MGPEEQQTEMRGQMGRENARLQKENKGQKIELEQERERQEMREEITDVRLTELLKLNDARAG